MTKKKYICRYGHCGEEFDDEMDAMMHLAYGHALLDDGEWIQSEKELLKNE